MNIKSDIDNKIDTLKKSLEYVEEFKVLYDSMNDIDLKVKNILKNFNPDAGYAEHLASTKFLFDYRQQLEEIKNGFVLLDQVIQDSPSAQAILECDNITFECASAVRQVGMYTMGYDLSTIDVMASNTEEALEESKDRQESILLWFEVEQNKFDKQQVFDSVVNEFEKLSALVNKLLGVVNGF